jgi:hypothetical protein
LTVTVVETLGSGGSRRALATTACLAVLGFELAFTVLRRLASGQSLAVGDRLHSYDLLTGRIGTRAKTTLAFCSAGGLAAALGLLVDAVPPAAGATLLAAAAAAAAVAGRRLWSCAPARARSPSSRPGSARESRSPG